MTLRKQTLRLGIWSTTLQLAKVGINGLTFMVLARWLSVREIGIFGTAFAVLSIAQIPVKMGLMEAIVRENRTDDAFFSTCFWLSFSIGICAAFVLLAAAALTAQMAQAKLAWYLLCFAIIPLVEACGIVPEAMLRRNLKFQSLAIRTLIGVSAASFLSVAFAYFEYSGIALILSVAVGSVVSSGIAMFMAGWRPRLTLNHGIARSILSCVFDIIGAGFASASIVPISQFLIGAIGGPSHAGAYIIAQRVVMLINNMTLEPARLIILPILSKIKDEGRDVASAISEMGAFLAAVMAPLYLGFVCIAKPLFDLVLAEKSEMVAPIAVALCFSFLPQLVSTMVTQFLTVDRQSRSVLSFTSLQSAVNCALSFVLAFISPLAVAIGYSARAYILTPFVLRAGLRSRLIVNLGFVNAIGKVLPASIFVMITGLFGSYLLENYAVRTELRIVIIIVIWLTLYPPLLFLVDRRTFCKIVNDFSHFVNRS